jgi:serine/threonine-protein kinase
MDVVAQAAAGLQAAHATGLVHRDIRPGNLLLASSGTVKITDWGISQATGSIPGTVTGIVTGTAEYVAPERIAGAQAAPASDLYALGIVAYECLAGTPPFAGEPPDVACAHRDHPVPPLPRWVPADVSTLVMRLVAKDPARRPGSAAEVAQQAGRLQHDLRDDFNAGAVPAPYPLAVAAAVQPPPPPMAPAPVVDDARRQVPAASRPASRAWTDARRLRRRPVLVLAAVAIAGLIGMVLAVTVGLASVQHLADAPAFARPGHSIRGTVAGPPARQPSSASPGRSARPGTSPGDTGTVPVVVRNHLTIAGSVSGRERIHRHRDGSDTGHGHGNGNRRGHSRGNGHGEGNGDGHGNGHSQGNGNGNGHGNGNAQVLSISS